MTEYYDFDQVMICTRHDWPAKQEDKVTGYFYSPYPLAKLSESFSHAIAIKGSSLTAVDAIKTLAMAMVPSMAIAKRNPTGYRLSIPISK